MHANQYSCQKMTEKKVWQLTLKFKVDKNFKTSILLGYLYMYLHLYFWIFYLIWKQRLYTPNKAGFLIFFTYRTLKQIGTIQWGELIISNIILEVINYKNSYKQKFPYKIRFQSPQRPIEFPLGMRAIERYISGAGKYAIASPFVVVLWMLWRMHTHLVQIYCILSEFTFKTLIV